MVTHLFSTAQTGYFYTTKRLRLGPPLTQIKYDPLGMPTSCNRLPGWLTNTLCSSKTEGLVCREEKEEVARRTRLYLSPIQDYCCIPYLLPTCIHPTSTLHPCSQAIWQISNRGSVLRHHYSILSTKARLRSGGYITSKGRVLRRSATYKDYPILVNAFGSCQRDTTTCALSKSEAWVTAPASMEWKIGYRG